MSPPLFSVIVACYNQARYVGGTLESVFAQTLRDFEVVVVDDGSTDASPEVLQRWADRVRVIRQENRGVAGAWNTGIRNASGRYLAFLAADDAWLPETLAKIASRFESRPEVGVVTVMAEGMDERSRSTGRLYGKRSPGESYSTVSLLWGDSGGASWFAVRREVLDGVGLYDETLRSAEECDLLLRMSFATRLEAIREPLLRYRVHAASLSQDRRLNASSWIRILDKLRREHPEFVRENGTVWRRAMGKELLRLGRETLAHGERGRATWHEAREALGRSIRTWPWFARSWLYLAWSWVAPASYRSWRRREEARRLGASG